MRRLRLGIDLDGVVADFNAGWIRRYNDEFSARLHPAQVTHWEGVTPLTHFADMEEFWSWARGADEATPSVFRHLPLYDGSVPVLRALARHHRLVIISSKPDWAIPDTLEWLAEHRIPSREIHFVWDKASVDCDVYLEDAPHNLEALVAAHPERTVCRMVRAWNDPVAGAVDVHGWQEFAAAVREVSEAAP